MVDRLTKGYRTEFIFLLLYIFLTILFTYPLIFKFNTSIYGYPSDCFSTIWKFWRWTKGDSVMSSTGPYLLHFYGKWMSILTNEVFAYNFLLFLSFPLSALTMYLLTFELTRHKYASFVSGIIYSFSLYHLWHGRFFQRIHQKRLFRSEYLDKETKEKLSDLTSPEASRILSSFGVKYVVVHTKEIFKMKNPLNSCQRFEIMPKPTADLLRLRLVKDFPKAVVYDVLE